MGKYKDGEHRDGGLYRDEGVGYRVESIGMGKIGMDEYIEMWEYRDGEDGDGVYRDGE